MLELAHFPPPEMANHAKLTSAAGIDVFFADPHSP